MAAVANSSSSSQVDGGANAAPQPVEGAGAQAAAGSTAAAALSGAPAGAPECPSSQASSGARRQQQCQQQHLQQEREQQERQQLKVLSAEAGQPAAEEDVEPGCLICMAAAPSDPTAVKGCSHTFCYVCIHQWGATRRAPTCPVCRGEMAALVLGDGREQVRPYSMQHGTPGQAHARPRGTFTAAELAIYNLCAWWGGWAAAESFLHD
jgi:hypothetical protein